VGEGRLGEEGRGRPAPVRRGRQPSAAAPALLLSLYLQLPRPFPLFVLSNKADYSLIYMVKHSYIYTRSYDGSREQIQKVHSQIEGAKQAMVRHLFFFFQSFFRVILLLF
jgi:hypothetical protein